MVESLEPQPKDENGEVDFAHTYEPPREISEASEKSMAQKMIKTIEGTNASEDKLNKIKTLYVQSDELAWLAEHCNRESDDAEVVFKQKRADILKLRDQIISGEIADFSKYLPDYEKRLQVLTTYENEKIKKDEKFKSILQDKKILDSNSAQNMQKHL